MKNKPNNLFTLSQETALKLSSGAWPDFLRTAAWNYKYDFTSQLLIYAQKPEATACASYDVWTSDTYRRMPRKGTGIALLNDSGAMLRLYYVFDISDTFIRSRGDTPYNPLWNAAGEKAQTVQQTLADAYLSEDSHPDTVMHSDAGPFYRSVAAHLVEEESAAAVEELLTVQESCALRNLSKEQAKRIFLALVTESISSMLQTRCGLQPDIDPEVLDQSRYFDSPAAISILGCTTQRLAKQALKQVEKAVRQWDNKRKEEIHHENHLSASRGASDSEPERSVSAPSEQIRPNAQEIPAGTKARRVHQPSSDRGTEQAPERNRGEDSAASRAHHDTSDEHDDGTTPRRYTGNDKAQNHLAENSRGTGPAGDALQITDEDIRRAITFGPPLEGGKYRLNAFAQAPKNTADQLLDILRKEYGTGSRTFMFTSGLSGTLSWDFNGLSFDRELPGAESLHLPWKRVSELLKGLAEANSYLDKTEMHQAELYFASQEALQARQQTGETLRVCYSIYGSNRTREAINAVTEAIRAYVYENSTTARQTLLGTLLELEAGIPDQDEPDVHRILGSLHRTLSVQAEDPYTLPSATDAGLVFSFPEEEGEAEAALAEQKQNLSISLPVSVEEIEEGMVLQLPQASYRIAAISDTHVVLEDIDTPLFSQTMAKSTLDAILKNTNRTPASKRNALRSLISANPFTADSVKEYYNTEISPSNGTRNYVRESIHTLRTALSGLLRGQYSQYYRSLSESERGAAPSIEQLDAILSDYVDESSIYAAEEVSPEVSNALRTPDHHAGIIAAAALRMSKSTDSSISQAGREGVRIFLALYRTDEAHLIKAAQISGWPENPGLDHEEKRKISVQEKKRSAAERNYAFLAAYAPAIFDGTLDYIRFESDSFEPLYIERIRPDRIAMAHTYTQYGDLMFDPEIIFAVDDERRELLPLSFEQSDPPYYRAVYDKTDPTPEGKDDAAERDINDFLTTWFSNLEYQGHEPVRGTKHAVSGDLEYVFHNGQMHPAGEEPQIREPEIDHPELRRMDQSRLNRSDKVVLADLLYHFSTYRYTFSINTPPLSDRDAERREANLSILSDIIVSENIEENLASIRAAKSIISRWFLPFDGIRLDILDEQERIISAAERVLLNPPQQAEEQDHKHTDTHTHTDTESIGNKGAEENLSDEGPTLWDYEDTQQPSDRLPVQVPVKALPLIDASGRINHRTADMHPHYGGPKQRYRNNISAIRLLKQLEEEERLATADEQEILSRYVGWGGLPSAFDANDKGWEKEYQELRELLTEEEYEAARASTLTAFYTPPVVIESIYRGLEQLGIQEGNLLDAGCGTGAFFGQAPAEAKLYGVELDSISGRIAQQLYQQANIAIEGFEKTRVPDNFFNAMVGNVPFGNFKVFDPKYNKYHFQIHDYFFAKGLDKIRPGGVLALVTSTGTLDKEDTKFRSYLSAHADLLGAIRLPNNTFRENAGTDVTSDILFLRKRSRPPVTEPDWVHTVQQQGSLPVNAYFASHPEMVLGDMRVVSGPYGPQLICQPREGESLQDALAKAIQHIQDDEPQITDEWEAIQTEDRISIPASPDVANYSYTVADDTIYFREDDRMYQIDTGKMQSERIKGMVSLRDTVQALIHAQLENLPDEEISRLQRQLNSRYDAYTKKYGLINSRGNALAFSDDSSYYLLCSLEQLDKNGEFAGKADIFTKRTISAKREVSHVETPSDALAVSISERGRADLPFMERLSGYSQAELLDSLQDQIFEDPQKPGIYLLAATYLSGNIREKLAQAKAAAQLYPGRYNANISALEKAMPTPLGPGEITVRLGATWVPPDIIRDFMYDALQTDDYHRIHRTIDVHYSELLNQWAIKNKGYERLSIRANSVYGIKEMDAYTILEHTLNLRDVKIYKRAEEEPEKQVLDVQATIMAQEKQEQLRTAFENWVWKDPTRSKRLCSIYNERFNSYRPPEYDGNMLTFHGISPLVELRKNQKDVVARILFNGNTQIAAEVGAGKTWMMTAAAMEGKHLGLCSKSMIVVPNHLIGQWATAVYELYPSAKVLAVTQKDFEAKNRKKFCSRIATGDYDIVILGHSQLEKIPLSAERRKRYLEEQINEITDGINAIKSEQGSPFTVKQLESKKRSLEQNLKKLTESKPKDRTVNFEELGVDRLFIDESDEFKNLFLYTKMQNVAGIAQTDSQKASDLFLKCRYMDELTGGKGNIHATGTPLSNTMAELYTTMRYLQYDLLRELGLHQFDAWASSFAAVKPVLELTPEGTGYRMRNRLTNFYNLPELMSIYRQIAEIQTQDTLQLPLPTVHYITKSLPPSQAQKNMIQQLAQRAEDIRAGKVRPEEDNMLCVVNDGRKLALDQRLMDESLPSDPNSKVNATADAVYDLWSSGKEKSLTQLVFCDISTPKRDQFNVYDALRDKLVEMGIPKEEIRFVHEATNDAQKEALFSQVRDGTVRVLMGSTAKMGTGTNVQDLLIGGHDMDCPWRPRDLTQRNGRVIRVGNTNDDVYIYRYVTEGTFDAYMYQLLESKQRFISQIFTSKSPPRQIEDIDMATISFAEIKAIASGNPLIKERVELELEISKLEMMRNRHIRNQAEITSLVTKDLPASLKSDNMLLSRLSKDSKRLINHPDRTNDGKYIPITVLGKTYKTASESGSALLSALNSLPLNGGRQLLGTYRGFDLVGERCKGDYCDSTALYVKGALTYPLAHTDKALGIIQRLNNLLDNIPQRVSDCEARIGRAEQQLREYTAEMGRPFSRESELSEKKSRLKKLDGILNTDLSPSREGERDSCEANQAASLSERITSARQRANINSLLGAEQGLQLPQR